MGSALEAVLNLKAQEAARQQQASDNLTQGLQMLQNARQQAISNQFAQMQYKAGLAEKGLKQNTDGSFARDESLVSPLEKLMQGVKLQAEAKTANNPQAYQIGQAMTGLQGTPVGNAIQGAPNDQMNEKDAFGEYTPAAKIAQDAEKQKQNEIIKGPAEGAVGKIALANESLKNINDIKTVLFPDGTPKSFKREIAFGANPPALRLPIIGRVGANVRRDNPIDPTDNKIVEKTQDVFRKMGASLSARQLIQTGVAARPEETQKLIEQFAPDFFSNPEAAYKGLDELSAFYKDYLNNALPEKRLGKDTAGELTTQSGVKFSYKKL